MRRSKEHTVTLYVFPLPHRSYLVTRAYIFTYRSLRKEFAYYCGL